MRVKTYDKKTAAFAGFIIQNLPEGLTAEIMDGWMQNPESTKRFLSGLIPPEVVPANANLGSKGVFVKWRTFRIGGATLKEFMHQRRENRLCDITSYSFESSFGKKALEMFPFEEDIETIVLSPAELGLTSTSDFWDVFNSKYLASWSEKAASRLPDGYVLELLPFAACPHIIDQYKDQPRGESLWLVADGHTGYRPETFRVERNMGLFISYHPQDHWDIDSLFVFWLRKK